MTIKLYSLLPGGTLPCDGSVIVFLFIAAVVAQLICGFVCKSRSLLRIAEFLLLLSWEL